MTYLPETRRQLLAAAERRAGRRVLPSTPRLRLGWIAPALSLAVAAAVAITFLSLRTGHHGSPAATAGSREIQLVYLAQPTAQQPVVTRQALELTIKQLNLRLSEIPHSHATVRILAGHHILVNVTTREGAQPVEALVGSDARLLFYDWESNVVLPDGRSAASELARRRPAALEVSQGSGSAAPGSPGAGAMGLYQAVRLASRLPYFSAGTSRVGTEYYLFAPHGGRLWAGPLDPGAKLSRSAAVRELKVGLPQNEQRQGHVLAVKQGTVVLEAAPKDFRLAAAFGAPGTRYYVLRDRVALSGDEITRPHASTGPSGEPDVQFGFRGQGAAVFQNLTAAIAHRGQLESAGAEQLFQHFAVALDDQLITVPQIDYTQYPDGVSGRQGADLSAGFTRASAAAVAKALRLGALPLRLKPLLEETRCRVSPARCH